MPYRVLVLVIVALATALLAGPHPLRAQEATPPADGAALLAAYGAAWSSGDPAQVGALYTADAVREDVPTGITSHGRDEIEAFARGLFATDDDARLEVTDGFVGESWAVVEWTFSGTRKETGGEVRFRGVSVLELADGLIQEESDYYDLPQLQQQIAAGGTPGAARAGSVTIMVYACPAELRQGADDQLDALLALCTPLDAPEVAPTLIDLAAAAGEPTAGMATAPGVYQWDDVAFGDYAIGGGGDAMPADLAGLRVMDASGATLQNPVLRLDETSPHVEYHYFYFRAEATPAA